MNTITKCFTYVSAHKNCTFMMCRSRNNIRIPLSQSVSIAHNTCFTLIQFVLYFVFLLGWWFVCICNCTIICYLNLVMRSLTNALDLLVLVRYLNKNQWICIEPNCLWRRKISFQWEKLHCMKIFLVLVVRAEEPILR